jgi:hypothetical protein
MLTDSDLDYLLRSANSLDAGLVAINDLRTTVMAKMQFVDYLREQSYTADYLRKRRELYQEIEGRS